MKNYIIYLTYMILFNLISSCSVPKFYNEIHLMHNNIIEEMNKDNYEDKTSNSSKHKDFHKLVFRKLKKELVNTNHIIYFTISDSDTYTSNSWYILYDVDNNIYYDLEYSDKSLRILDTSNFLKDAYNIYVFDNFNNNKCNLLIERGNKFQSGIRTYDAIFEVDLNKGIHKKCYFKSFFYLDW